MCDSNRVRKVLIIDDERLVAESLIFILARNGYAARAAYSCEEAVDLAREFEPDLLISDVRFSGMMVMEAASEILSFLPECRVILFSGQATTLELLRHCQHPTLNCEILAKLVSVETVQDPAATLA